MKRLFDTLNRAPWRSRLVLTVVVAFVLIRLWLVAGQTITALGEAVHDDAFFMSGATNLVSGKWLGSYSQMTLIKGPFYSMWIATVFALGIPLLFSEHVLYVVSCGVLVQALSPTLQSARIRLALFAVLLLNPASMAEGVMSRVLRDAIYSSLPLLVLGTALGLAFRQDRPFRSILPWVLGLGASLAAYYLCREERIWLLPSLLVIFAGAFVRSPSTWHATLRRTGVAIAVFVVLVGAVVVKNGYTYGVYVVTEFTEGPFMAAFGTLARVRVAVDRPRLPIPAESRRRIYEVSPRFAELAPYLEGDVGHFWSSVCRTHGIHDDIPVACMMWALRDAAAVAKHYTTGDEAARYWTEVAAEVERACADGRLECGPRGFGFLPPLQRIDIKAFGETLSNTIQDVVLFNGVVFHSNPSLGKVEQFDVFRDITRTRLAPDPKGIERKLRHQDGLLTRKEKVLQGDHAIYHAVTPLLACAALLAFGIAVVVAISRRYLAGSLLAAGALLAGAISRTAVLSLVQSSSFLCINAGYLTPTHALLVGFMVLALHAAFVAVRKVPLSRKDDSQAALGFASDPPMGDQGAKMPSPRANSPLRLRLGRTYERCRAT